VYEYSRLAAAATIIVTGAGVDAGAGSAGDADAVSLLAPAKRLPGAARARNTAIPNKTRRMINWFLFILDFLLFHRYKIAGFYGKTWQRSIQAKYFPKQFAGYSTLF
jgi:hypothetical protein